MVDVQLSKGYTRLANELLTAVALAPWGESSAYPRMVLALIRITYGCNRRDADLGGQQWTQLTGLSERSVLRAKLALQEAGVLILVRDYDARTQKPQRWRLQKNYTKWGRFSVSIEAVEEAEQAVADSLQQVSPKVLPPMTPPDTHDRGGQVSPVSGEQVSPVSVRQVSRVGVPTVAEPLPHNDSEGGKDSKDRKDSTTTASSSDTPALPRAHAPAHEEEQDHQGDMSRVLDELLGDVDDISRRGFAASAGSIIRGDDVSAWLAPGGGETVAGPDRPRLFRLAVERCIAERQFGAGALRTALRYVILQQLNPFTPPIATDSPAAAARDRESRANGRPRQPNGRGRSSEPVQAMAAPVAPVPRAGPTPEQRQRVVAWGKEHPDEAAQLLARAKTDMGVFYAKIEQSHPERAKGLLVDQFTRRVLIDVLKEDVST